MENETPKEQRENKRRFQTWFRPSTIDLVGRLYEEDNCRSHSEFIEKSIHFYAGYIIAERGNEYLPRIVTSTIKGIVDESDNKQNNLLFKMAVEIAMMQNILASMQDIDELSLERLRGQCVKEVKRLRGTFSFEDAVEWQKG